MDVAVFWDYENVRVRKGEASHAAVAVQKAVLALPGVRRIMQRRLYYDARKPTEKKTGRVGLSELGWTLVDCPSRGFSQKETIDKKLIVDALFHGVTESERGGRVCVVLITSDGDYAYLLSRLRDVRVHTVVISAQITSSAKQLLDACDVALNWHDVLSPKTIAEPPDSAVAPDQPAIVVDEESQSAATILPALAHAPNESVSSRLEDIQEEQLATQTAQALSISTTSIPLSSAPGLAFGLAASSVPRVSQEQWELSNDENSSMRDASEGRHMVFLYCLDALQRRGGIRLLARDGEAWRGNWVKDISVSTEFLIKNGGIHDKELYQSVRMSAEVGRFVSVGRWTVGGTRGQMAVSTAKWSPDMEGRLSTEFYLQLTDEGLAQLESEEGGSSADATAQPTSPSPDEAEEARKWIVSNTTGSSDPFYCVACKIGLNFGPDNRHQTTMHLGGWKHRAAESTVTSDFHHYIRGGGGASDS